MRIRVLALLKTIAPASYWAICVIAGIVFAADTPAPKPLTPEQRIAFLEKSLSAAKSQIKILGMQLQLATYREQSRQALERQKSAEALVVQNYETGFRENFEPAKAEFDKAEAARQESIAATKKELGLAETCQISPDGKEATCPAPGK